MDLEFESDHRAKVLYMTFKSDTLVSRPADLLEWRKLWMAALASWHSPYKVLVDCSHLRIADDSELSKDFETMLRFFQGLHMRKICGFTLGPAVGLDKLPFEVCASRDEAAKTLGIRDFGIRKAGEDFRSKVQFDNHFQQQIIELSIQGHAHDLGKSELQTVKDKLLNNLMLWHSHWNLLIDCQGLKISAENHRDFEAIVKQMKSFYLKEVVGYSPPKGSSYPFQTYRSRHKAVLALTDENRSTSGDVANCRSRQSDQD